MITEDYVSFETAKLLKEDGFNIPVRFEYRKLRRNMQIPQFHRHLRNFNGDEYKELRSEWYSAPTLQMAMKWLREVHNIDVAIYPYGEYVCNNYQFDVYKYNNFVVSKDDGYISYEEACEAAIKYCLENLI